MLAACAATLLAGGCVASQPPLKRFEFTRLQMGVQSRIVLYAPDRLAAESSAAAGFDRIAALDAVMSDYRRDSDLSQLCDAAGGPAIPAHPDLYRILELAAEISDATQGVFDVTIGPCVLRWRASRHSGHLPAPDELAAAQSLVNWQLVELDPQRSSVRLVRPGMRLDLGGIAKGYAAEAALRELTAHGCPRALVALAGDLAVGAPPPGRQGWEIARGSGPHAPSLVVQHAAISTSGDTEHVVTLTGVRYSHIVDPHTGLGATSSREVTVAVPLVDDQPGRAGSIADATATALSIRGDDLARRLQSRFPGIRIYSESPAAHAP